MLSSFSPVFLGILVPLGSVCAIALMSLLTRPVVASSASDA